MRTPPLLGAGSLAIVAALFHLTVSIPPLRASDLTVTLHDGQSFALDLGQSRDVLTPGCDCPCISWQINTPGTAIRIDMLDKDSYNGRYEHMFMYSVRSLPPPTNGIYGTPQYCGHNVRVSCVPQSPPEATAYIPLDATNLNRNANLPIAPVPGNRMLALRRAFFWENSEQLAGLHGPFGDIKINVCDPSIADMGFDYLQYHWDELLNPFPPYPIKRNSFSLYGPVWGSREDPPPANEWLDGPWGCSYSNAFIYDWDDPYQEFYNRHVVSLVVAEAEGAFIIGTNPEDFLDATKVYRATDPSVVMHFDVSMFGWVELQNVDVTGREPTVDVAAHYWYPSWNGMTPAQVTSPEIADQYRPLPGKTISEMENEFVAGERIGILGGQVPNGSFRKAMRYVAIGGPVRSGSEPPSGVLLYSGLNYEDDMRWFTEDVPDLDDGRIDFADVALSVRLSDVKAVILYDEAQYHGHSQVVTRDIADLRSSGWGRWPLRGVGSLRMLR